MNVDFEKIKSSLVKLYDKIATLPILRKVFSAIAASKHLRNVIYGIIGFFVLVFVLRRIFRSKSDDEFNESYFEEEKTPGSAASPGAGEEKKASLDEVRRSASANPEKIANLLKSWLSEEAA